MLNSYRRTVTQVDYLDQILGDGDQKLDVVLQLAADNDELAWPLGQWSRSRPRRRAAYIRATLAFTIR